MNSQGSKVEKNTHTQSANAKNFAYKRALELKFCLSSDVRHKGHSRPPRQRVLWSDRTKYLRYFSESLSRVKLPSDWKSAEIAPIHKKHSKEAAKHYRPISLLPIISKLLERRVFDRLYDHLKCLITGFQHGFLQNRSCVTQLLSVLHDIGF